MKARGRIVPRSDLKPRDDGGGGEFVVENRDRYQPGLGSQPARAVALGWKEVDYFLFFFTNSEGRIWGIAEDNRGTCGLDPGNMRGSKTQQKLDDINDKKRRGIRQ